MAEHRMEPNEHDAAELPPEAEAMRERALIAGAAHTLCTSDMPQSLDRARLKLGSTVARLAGHHLTEAEGWDERWWVDDLLIESLTKLENGIDFSGRLIWGDDATQQWTEPYHCDLTYAGCDLNALRFQVGDASVGLRSTPYRRKPPRRSRAVSEWILEFVVEGARRDLTRRERATLDFMLSGDQDWVMKLREQARSAYVVGMCPCGCPTFDIAVDRIPEHRAPIGSGTVLESSTDSSPPHELIVFADEGWLSSLELVTYEGDPPKKFPEVDAFEPPRAWGPPTTPEQ